MKKGSYVDFTGQRNGRLLAVSRDAITKRWNCQCDCGKMTAVSQAKFRSIKSCGCLRLERARQSKARPVGHSGFVALWNSYKIAARNRGLSFELTQNQFREMVNSDCYYCGLPPSAVRKDGKQTAHSAFRYTGIDRVNNKDGYTWDNSIPCCKQCNYGKRNSDVSSFYTWIFRVADHLRRPNHGK